MRRTSRVICVSFVAAALAAACGTGRTTDLFEDADIVFTVEYADHHDCTTGTTIFSPEFRLSKAGIKWQDDGQQLDILLEYGGITQYKEGTYTSVGFIDKTRPGDRFFDPHLRSLHSRGRVFSGLEMGGSGLARASVWAMGEYGEWTESEVTAAPESVEVMGNQVRLSVPANLLDLSGRSDPKIINWSWVVFSGVADDESSCVEAPSDEPWPLILEVVENVPS